MGLKWTQVNWEHNVISIQEARLASDSGTYDDTPRLRKVSGIMECSRNAKRVA